MTPGFVADSNVLAFARANPGKLYIDGDEPDGVNGGCQTPMHYVRVYYNYVTAIRSVDPTARFSPAGVSDQTDQCCPQPGTACRTTMHYTGYTQQFYTAYIDSIGSPPPVDEWRFHNFAQWVGSGDLTTWLAEIRDAATWSAAHGAPMVLGSWGFLGWNITAEYPMSEFLTNLQMAKDSLFNDTRINQAVWWALEPSCCGDGGTPYPHNLRNPDGQFTVEGLTYGAITPAGLVIDALRGQMRGRWTNTTSGPGVEVQFFQLQGTTWVATSDPMWQPPGATTTPYYNFPSGAKVRFRARYSTAQGPGPWSPYSASVTIPF
jgi:hypothetical protein